MNIYELGWLDLNDARPGQQNAIETIVNNAVSGKRQTGIILPTRYGKSDTIRIASAIMFVEGFAATNLVVSPNSILRDQIVKEKKMRECFLRYNLMHSKLTAYLNMEELKFKATSYGMDFAPNNEFLISITAQMLTYYVDEFAEWVNSVVYRTKLPVFIHFDEVQMASYDNVWGNVIKRLVDNGANIIGYTATAYRGDEERILGFEYTSRGTEPLTYTTMRPYAEDPEKVIISHYSGEREYYELKADYHHTFRMAYDEKVLCSISRQTVDADVQKIIESSTPMRLSQMGLSDTRRVLGRLVRDINFIEQTIREGVHKLNYIRSIHPQYEKAQMIVFCQNDETGYKPNEHATTIQKAINKLDSSLKVIIVTQATDEDNNGKKARELINEFANGKGDVMIVKNMGGVGLDIASLKVAVDLSSVRTSANCVQRWNRATTLWHSLMVAQLITPADALSQQIFTDFIEVEGGATDDFVELVKEVITTPEQSQQPTYLIDQSLRGKADDTKGNIAMLEMLDLAYSVLDHFPMLVERLTIPEIAERAKAFGIQPSQSFSMPIESGSYVAQVKSRIDEIVKKAANFTLTRQRGRGYSGSGDTDYSTVIRKIKYQIRVQANVKTEYDKIGDKSEIDRYMQATFDVCRSYLENSGDFHHRP